MMVGVAVLDTNVLYSSSVRNVLLCHVEQELFQPVWSDHIFKELGRNLQDKAGCSAEQWSRLHEQISVDYH